MKCSFHTVKSDKLCAGRACAHHNLFPFHLGEVKAMERLPDAVEDKVGDVDDIVDGALSDGK